MTSEQIFAIRDLSVLYKMWSSYIPDSEKIDVASMIDRIEAYNRAKAKANYNQNEVKDIINVKYKGIL